jgi:methionyl-tRNA formyltransferase
MTCVLFLSNYNKPDNPLIDWLRAQGEEVIVRTNKIKTTDPDVKSCSVVVSFGYLHVIRQPIIDMFAGKIINLHISLLPHNKGVDPNLWSYLYDTPKGVTIHRVDKGLDTGDILLQQELKLGMEETLTSSYFKLQDAIQKLFHENWNLLKENKIEGKPQQGDGQIHYYKDRPPFDIIMPEGWNTPVRTVVSNYWQWKTSQSEQGTKSAV